MLLFEFVGELFQFEQREPEFDVSSQLPPKSAAFIPMLPPAFLLDDPRAQHLAHLGHQHLCRLDLMGCDATHLFAAQKPQPKSQMRETRICDVQAGNLIRFPRLYKQLDLP